MQLSMNNLVGKSNGHFKFKHNRAQKIIDQWDLLKEKLIGMILRGGCETHTSKCAYAVLLMMHTGIRVGNEKSAEGYICENTYHEKFGKKIKTYGLTTLRVQHVKRTSWVLYLNFLGKKGVKNALYTNQSQLVFFAKILLKDKKPINLFIDITPYELTKFVKRYVGKNYSPKDIRTAYVNKEFKMTIDDKLKSLRNRQVKTRSDINKVISNSVEEVAERVGHTKSICRSAYLSKDMLESYKEYMINNLL